MATAAIQLDEDALVIEQIRQIKLPEGVTFKRIEQSQDWTGYPMLRVFFSSSKRVPLTKKRVKELAALQMEVFDRVISLDLGKWPYTELLESR